GWLPLIEYTGKLLVGETVNIIQHPNCEPKQMAIRHNQVVDALELFLHYQTDTDPGSSGAPVFNDQWEVVALHHSGVPKRNDKGEVLTSDGRLWQEWMGEQRIAWLANEGVRVSRLVRHIREQELPPQAEDLRRQLLEAAPPPLELPVLSEADQPLPGEVWLPEESPAETAPPSGVSISQTMPGSAGLAGAPSGASSWTIPLRLSVSFGAPVLEGTGSPAEPAGEGRLAIGGVDNGEGGDLARERWFLFGQRPPSPPAPPPAPPVSAADFRLACLDRSGFDWQASLSLCLASDLAYSPAAAVKAQALAWGFSACVFVEQGAAQGFLAWTSEVAMVTFRGTESTRDWLSNLRLIPRELPGLGRVHGGFLAQFQALRPELEHHLNARSSLPLLVTGHSLGGAIAVLAASTWAATRPVRALYTYGQPAVAADTQTAQAMAAALPDRWHRLVNDADVVPRVPPNYRHAGHLLHFDGEGRVTSPSAVARSAGGGGAEEAALNAREAPTADSMLSPEAFQALQEQLRTGATSRGLERGFNLIGDHMLPGYLSRIRQQIS
ncbi:MAG: lipase family protein, partial [Cyanobacteriota bacterium]